MPDDVYVGNYETYSGAFVGMVDSQASVFPPLSPPSITQPVQPGVSYSGSYADMELRSSTGALRESIDTAKSVMGQITGAVSSTVNAIKGLYSSAVSTAISQPVQKAQFGMPSTEVGRYVGSASYLESMKGAFGYRSSPFMTRGDYQQVMSNDFVQRTTLLGGSAGGVAAEFGAGYLGSKLLGPLISKGLFGTVAGGMLGYMGGGYAASHIMGRINQGLEFDSLIKDVSARTGIDEGGREPGFNAGNRRKIAKELRKGGLGLGDYADVMMYGSEAGLFANVTNPDEFVSTVKNAAKQVSAIMKILRETDVRDAIEDIATFKQWGIPMEEQVFFAMHTKSVGRSLGLTAKGAMELAASGAQVGMQMGYTGGFGAQVSMHGALIGKAMLQAKAVSETEMARYGGPEKYGEAVNWSLMRKVETPLGKMLTASMMKKGEKGEYVLDEELYKRYARGEVGIQELQHLAAGKLREDTTLYDKAMNSPEQLQSVMGDDRWRKLMSETYRTQVKRIADMGYSQEKSELIASMAIMGNSEEAGWLRGYDKSEPTVARKDVEVRENERIEKSMEEAKTERGISARLGKYWGKTGGAVLGKINRGIDDYIVDPVVGTKETVKDWVDTTYEQKVLGLHIAKLPEQKLPKGLAVGELSEESRKRVDERFGEIQKRAESSQNKEVSATVYADELKQTIEGFGSTKWNRGKDLGGYDAFNWRQSTGEKLIQAGAYENIGSLGVALKSKSKEDTERLSKQAGLYEEGTKKAEELRGILENATEEQKKELLAIIQKLSGEIDKTGAGGLGKALITQQSEIPVDIAKASGGDKPQKVDGVKERRIWDEYQGKFITGPEIEQSRKEWGRVFGENELGRPDGGYVFEKEEVSKKTSWPEFLREESAPVPEGEGGSDYSEGGGGYVFNKEEVRPEGGYAFERDEGLAVPEKISESVKPLKGTDHEYGGFGPRIDSKGETGFAKLDEHFDSESWRKKWGGVSYESSGDVPDDVPEDAVEEAPSSKTVGDGPQDAQARWRERLENAPMGSEEWLLATDMLNKDRSELTKEPHLTEEWWGGPIPETVKTSDAVRQQNELLGGGAGVPRNVGAGFLDDQADGEDTKKTEEATKKAAKALGGTADSAQNLTKTLNGLANTLKMVFNKSVSSNY